MKFIVQFSPDISLTDYQYHSAMEICLEEIEKNSDNSTKNNYLNILFLLISQRKPPKQETIDKIYLRINNQTSQKTGQFKINRTSELQFLIALVNSIAKFKKEKTLNASPEEMNRQMKSLMFNRLNTLAREVSLRNPLNVNEIQVQMCYFLLCLLSSGAELSPNREEDFYLINNEVNILCEMLMIHNNSLVIQSINIPPPRKISLKNEFVENIFCRVKSLEPGKEIIVPILFSDSINKKDNHCFYLSIFNTFKGHIIFRIENLFPQNTIEEKAHSHIQSGKLLPAIVLKENEINESTEARIKELLGLALWEIEQANSTNKPIYQKATTVSDQDEIVFLPLDRQTIPNCVYENYAAAMKNRLFIFYQGKDKETAVKRTEEFCRDHIRPHELMSKYMP